MRLIGRQARFCITPVFATLIESDCVRFSERGLIHSKLERWRNQVMKNFDDMLSRLDTIPDRRTYWRTDVQTPCCSIVCAMHSVARQGP